MPLSGVRTMLHIRQADISVSSLTKLEDISDVPQRRYVRHLAIRESVEDNRSLGLAGQSSPTRTTSHNLDLINIYSMTDILINGEHTFAVDVIPMEKQISSKL